MFDDRVPIGHPARHRLKRTDDMRQQKLSCTPAIVSDLIDTAAALKQKTTNQRSGVM